MLANTLTITISATPYVLVRVNQDNFGSLYRLKSATGVMTLQIRHSTEKQGDGTVFDRHNMFFEHRVYATATDVEKVYTSSAVFRMKDVADPAYLKALTTGFATLLSAQKDAIIDGDN